MDIRRRNKIGLQNKGTTNSFIKKLRNSIDDNRDIQTNPDNFKTRC